MTSSVEMGMGKKSADLNMKSVGFLYQHDRAGNPGMDGKKVEMHGVPVMKTPGSARQGNTSSTSSSRKAKEALENALNKRGVKSSNYPFMGFNGRGNPDDKKTWEMPLGLPR